MQYDLVELCEKAGFKDWKKDPSPGEGSIVTPVPFLFYRILEDSIELFMFNRPDTFQQMQEISFEGLSYYHLSLKQMHQKLEKRFIGIGYKKGKPSLVDSNEEENKGNRNLYLEIIEPTLYSETALERLLQYQ